MRGVKKNLQPYSISLRAGPGVIISITYYFIGAIYIAASRDLKELESIERASLSQHISETFSDITTIRAFGAIGQYSTGNYAYIPVDWPSSIGVVEYDAVSARYAPGLEQVFNELNFTN